MHLIKLEEQEKIDILDLGCGTGSLVSFLRPYAKKLVGIDLSTDMIEEAKKKGLYDTLYNNELDQYLEETSSEFDVVIAAAVMIHFFDLENTFTLIRNCLKKDGKFIFSVFEGRKKNIELNRFKYKPQIFNYGLSKLDARAYLYSNTNDFGKSESGLCMYFRKICTTIKLAKIISVDFIE